MNEKPRMRLGEALLQRGLLNQKQLDIALQEQKHVDHPLGRILVDLGFVESFNLAEQVAADVGLPLVRAADLKPDPLIVSALDAEFVREVRAFPIEVKDGMLHVAMCEPSNPELLGILRQRFVMGIEAYVLPEEDLIALIRKFLSSDTRKASSLLDTKKGEKRSLEDQPIEELTKAIILEGIHQGATDVHLQPESSVTRVRYRLDGVLKQGDILPPDVTSAVVSRIKILSDLDIAERRRPQDGRMHLDVDGRRVHLRVSVMPVAQGESVVLRVLDRAGSSQKLEDLGISERTNKLLTQISNQPHGLFLVTGPTGSGKTTTLYGMLREVDALRRNVATVEDPVEYDLPFIRQSQVDTSVGFDFNSGLRALLRQDPDVILVGEIRDEETAEMAVKASMTGHLVFSTLHTNSALGAIPRLADLGVAPYLLGDTIIGVLGQRLVRKICRDCIEEVPPTEDELIWLGTKVENLWHGKGCERCGGTGYIARVAITELLLPTDELSESIRQGADGTALLNAAVAGGFREMGIDGREKVMTGQTTVEEVLRVSRHLRIVDGGQHAA